MHWNARSLMAFVSLVLFQLLVCVILTMSARADELYGSIRGTVADQSGALIPDAKITVTNAARGLNRTVASAKDGEFAFLQLPVGDYSVRIEKSGFSIYTATGIHLDVNQVYALNAKIELGAVSEVVSVEANQLQVETSTPQRGDVVDASQILDLPLIGRNWVNLQQLESGVVAASDGRGEYATNGAKRRKTAS
jgi:Carboxypeptidase regulatory-like domain